MEVHLPDLTPEQQERLRAALREAGVDPAAAKFTRPRLSLEQLYLRTVQGGVGSLTEGAKK